MTVTPVIPPPTISATDNQTLLLKFYLVLQQNCK